MSLLIIGICVVLLFFAYFNLIRKAVWGYVRGGCHGPSPSIIKTIIIPWSFCFIITSLAYIIFHIY